MNAMKDFHIGDILTVTHDRLLSPRGMQGLYDILNWMTGENLFTHQLPRVAREATPVILAALPQLKHANVEGIDASNWKERLAELVTQFGETLPVPKMTADEHERIDPLSEAAEHFPPDKIHIIRV